MASTYFSHNIPFILSLLLSADELKLPYFQVGWLECGGMATLCRPYPLFLKRCRSTTRTKNPFHSQYCSPRCAYGLTTETVHQLINNTVDIALQASQRMLLLDLNPATAPVHQLMNNSEQFPLSITGNNPVDIALQASQRMLTAPVHQLINNSEHFHLSITGNNAVNPVDPVDIALQASQRMLLLDLDPATAQFHLSITGNNPVDIALQRMLLLDLELDPATAKLIIPFIGPFLSAFSFLFIIRIVMSWYPKLPVGKFPYVVAYAPTEPILVPTRKVIPPLGGVDVTPVVWFGLLSFLNEILVGPQGLLVLLSQQV